METVTCRARVRFNVSSAGKAANLVDLVDCPEVGFDTRLKWINGVARALPTPDPLNNIREWDIVLNLDGTIELLAVQPSGGDHYPAQFRIPPNKLEGLNQEERAKKAERFAMGSLLYQIMSGRKPLEGMNDEEVQHRFSAGEFPDDVFTIQIWPMIFNCWGLEVPDNVENLIAAGGDPGDPNPGGLAVGLLRGAGRYARDHPVSFGLQVVGGIAFVTSLAVVPVLGAVGFTPIGPAAGSIAASWQASIGVVEAGSLFAWCQSAAMGGAAVQGILATGVAGAGAAGAGWTGRLWRVFGRGNQPPQAA